MPTKTKRLYYDNPFLLNFKARVVERRTVPCGAGQEEKDCLGLILDRSAFYPTSGGQLHDLGTINGVPVLEVRDDEGEVVHVMADEVPRVTVTGQVDLERRFDNMQQHTGQHILSQACIEILNAETVSSHLSAEDSTIDIGRVNLTAEMLARAEERANDVVFEDRPVIARFVADEEVAKLPLRKRPAGHERMRIVEVQGYDWSACGGTHCLRSGQVGPIRIVHWERRGAETRLTFLCGWRALRHARWEHGLLTEMGGLLSVGIPYLPDTVAKLAAAEEESRKGLEAARRQLLSYEAADLYQKAKRIGPARVVRAVLTGRSLEEVKMLAREISALPGAIALLGLRGEDARLCFARAQDVPGDMGALVRQAAAVVGGRGGGRPHEAQGGGPEVDKLEEALDAAVAQLRG